jgi:RNA polymerase sigma-70 factor (ECF subfamily)
MFYESCSPRLGRYLMSLASNTALAEDAANDAMLAAWDNWDELLTYARPDSWLFAVATRKLRRIEARFRDSLHAQEELASSDQDLRVAAMADEWVEGHMDLIVAVRSLPRRQSEVIGLHYFGGYTIGETAEILGIQEGSVRKHLHRGLLSLRRREGVPGSSLRLIRSIPL